MQLICDYPPKGQSLTIDLIDVPDEFNYRPNRVATGWLKAKT
jgi:hypothetical protein